jgi:1,2-diacylglycerol 3-alpha-glucosyltransferase
VPLWFVHLYLRLFLSNYDALVCPSEKARDYFQSFLPGIEAVVIGNGVSRTSFQAVPLRGEEIRTREALGLRPADRIVLYAGRIAREKRVIELLEALVPLLRTEPHVKALFVGSGPGDRELAMAVEQSAVGRQVVLAGRIPWHQMHHLYSLADLFVTVSLSEMHPMTLIEASLCGLPVVARRDPAYAGLVRDGYNGFQVGSDRDIAARASYLLRDEGKRQRFAENSLALSEEFNAESHAGQIEALYRRAREGERS